MKPGPSFHLRSSKFPILPDEEDELCNEGTYGKALSEYIKAHLSKSGDNIPFIVCEDWGWRVEIKGQPFTLGCCVYGASVSENETSLYVTLSCAPGKKWSFSRFRFVDTSNRINHITSTLREIFTKDNEIEIVDEDCDYPL